MILPKVAVLLAAGGITSEMARGLMLDSLCQ
jgi:hypothetical protein